MQLPLTDADTLFEELLQDLPPTVSQMAREFKAFVRAKKVKTPEHLLRLVLLYCGLDKPLREVAGTFTALYESITDQSVAERLRACGPWVKALLRQMLPVSAVTTLPGSKPRSTRWRLARHCTSRTMHSATSANTMTRRSAAESRPDASRRLPD